jgi:hypothetical protein
MRKKFCIEMPLDSIGVHMKNRQIRMDDFISFLSIDMERIKSGFLGDCTGWTRLENKDNGIIITGGIVKGIEYLESIQREGNYHNNYNNYCTPLNILDLLTNCGVRYFIEYYEPEIRQIKKDLEDSISYHKQKQIDDEKQLYEIKEYIKSLTKPKE